MSAEFKDIILFSIAVLGAALGVLNFWQSVSRDRVKIRVRPITWLDSSQTVAGPGIQVVNLSAFAVTITQVGFRMRDGKDRVMIPAPVNPHQKNWPPKRLESRESLVVHYAAETLDAPEFLEVRDAFAKTACGCAIEGTSKALKQLIEIASTVQPQQNERSQRT